MKRKNRPGSGDLKPLRRSEFVVLSVLVDTTLHGYGIVAAVEERSAGELKLRPTNLYRILDRLVDRGLLEEAGSSSEGDDGSLGPARGRLYRASPAGIRRFEDESRLLRRLMGGAPAEQER